MKNLLLLSLLEHVSWKSPHQTLLDSKRRNGKLFLLPNLGNRFVDRFRSRWILVHGIVVESYRLGLNFWRLCFSRCWWYCWFTRLWLLRLGFGRLPVHHLLAVQLLLSGDGTQLWARLGTRFAATATSARVWWIRTTWTSAAWAIATTSTAAKNKWQIYQFLPSFLNNF